ncbi:excalibur calcium-binding domain-containing protein [Glycomyces sp. YM15]|uniref:excalibur calcium-binding domain-containing protein n=1 Tax=Glycomyces sp. YM15 TaxID=2800446 RepID=UPI0019665BF8|nr:excalibur calcium-binding domain-containing protein [Glycomyces sp. YM15]
MTLVLGVIATSPAGGERTQDREVTHDFVLVDFQPLDTGDDDAMMEESDAPVDSAVEPEETDTEASEEPFENCDEARAEGEAPVDESHPRFGEHLDADSDGTGCENWSGPAQAPEGSQYQNCAEARADGATDIKPDEPGYAEHLDGDNDGIACES